MSFTSMSEIEGCRGGWSSSGGQRISASMGSERVYVNTGSATGDALLAGHKKDVAVTIPSETMEAYLRPFHQQPYLKEVLEIKLVRGLHDGLYEVTRHRRLWASEEEIASMEIVLNTPDNDLTFAQKSALPWYLMKMAKYVDSAYPGTTYCEHCETFFFFARGRKCPCPRNLDERQAFKACRCHPDDSQEVRDVSASTTQTKKVEEESMAPTEKSLVALPAASDFTNALKTSLEAAAWRTAAENVTNFASISMAAKLKGNGDKRSLELALLIDTPEGRMAIATALGYGLMFSPKLSSDPRVARLAKELQVYSAKSVTDTIASYILEPVTAAITSALAGLPEVSEEGSGT